MTFSRRLGVALVALLLAVSAAAESLPETPAGKAIAGWLAAYNSADRAQLLQFLSANYTTEILAQRSAEQRADSILEMRRDNGPLQVSKVVRSSDTEIQVITRAPEIESQIQFTLKLENGKVPGVRIDMNPPGVVAKVSDEQLIQQLSAYLDKLAKGDRFSGVAVLAKDGNVLFRAAHGKANSSGAAIDPDTRFNLASMNKMMTAVAMAQLAQKGKLKFTDTIAQHLPDYPNQEVAQKVTIAHLLNHTSGIGNYMKPAFFKAELKSLSDYLPFFANDPLKFEPGQGWQYSNAAFIVAGMIIEKASGMDYFRYVEKNIFAPAGMTASGFFTRDERVANRAFGFTRNQSPNGERVSSEPMLPWRGGPAGGGYSTASDLLKFAQALRTHKLLNPKFTDLITSIQSRLPQGGEDEGYGYGFVVDDFGTERVVGHGGGFPGTSTNLVIHMRSGYVIVVLTNYDPPAAERVSNWVLARLQASPNRASD